MATRSLFRPLLQPFALPALFATSSLLLLQSHTRQPIRADSTTLSQRTSTFHTTRSENLKSGRWNERSFAQISSGSLIGLGCGVLVSLFSKPLALLVGLLIVGVQYLEYKGIHIVPYTRLQKYFKSIDLRSAVQDNVAFKLSFGVTFALAGFGSL